jgi:hypothetical protein
MWARDYRDLVTGAVFTFGGLFVTLYCVSHYKIGTLNYMGPGMFPAGLGAILAAFGIAIMVPAWFRQVERPEVEWRSAIAILAGVAVFAGTVGMFGIIPATLALVVVSSLADRQLSLVGILILAAVLIALVHLIFASGLGLPLDTIRWPF